MPSKRLIIPIFIPHEACPYRCVYCDQNNIAGVRERADREWVEQTIETYLNSMKPGSFAIREAAFYGGTFTGMAESRQRFLLSLVQPWIESGDIQSIRLSTHPDFISREGLDLLEPFSVKTIELGIQSTDASVLEQSGRGGSLAGFRRAVDLIRRKGFRLGLQLMAGLPGDTAEKFLQSVEDTIEFKPDFVRIYPALVIKDTALHTMHREGRYKPWGLEETIQNCKQALVRFKKNGIPVIRLGLPSEPLLIENIVDGPHHPALKYLVECRIYLDKMAELLSALSEVPSRAVFEVPSREISIYTGHKKENITQLKRRFDLKELRLNPREHLGDIQWAGASSMCV